MNWKNDGPIIQSLLDTDFYKFTMGQLVFQRYPDAIVTFSLINRSRAPLADLIPKEALREQLDHVRRLRLTNSELHYLRGTNEYGDRMFKEDYLEFLRALEMPDYNLEKFEMPDYNLEKIGSDYRLEFTAPWPKVMLWETLALSIVKELYRRAQMARLSRLERDAVYACGVSRLLEKIRMLRQYPGITLSDFGTRRRFSRGWHNYVVEVLAEELPDQLRGTSNVLLAMKHGLLPMGTSAHELPMVIAAMAFGNAGPDKNDTEILATAQNEVLRAWFDLYGHGLSIALPDTFGSVFFFETAPASVAVDWKGTRQDSGDPFKYGKQVIKWHRWHGADPGNKIIVFSDQLNAKLIVELYLHFCEQIGLTFGIGTNITDDLGLDSISIVTKASRVNGRSTVKLSDNLAKAMGDPKEVERYKRAADYTDTKIVECIS